MTEMWFMWRSECPSDSTLKNHKKWSIFGEKYEKKVQKTLLNLHTTAHFSIGLPKTEKPNSIIRISNTSLASLSSKYQNGKIAEEVRLSTVLLSYVKRKSWDRLFRSGGSHFIYCSQLWASSLPENLCCCLDLDLLQHNRRILRFFSNSIFCLSWFCQKQKKT